MSSTSDALCMVLQVLVVASLVVAMQRVRQMRTGRALVALAGGAFVMAGLTTPALAASEAGEHARPHFGH